MRYVANMIAGAIMILMFLTGCSDQPPPLVLTGSTVGILHDRCGKIEIAAGKQKGKIIEPVSLSYDFTLKNTGNKTLGGKNKPGHARPFEFEDGIKLTIEPNEKLKNVVIKAMGFNIFDEEEREQAQLGVGGKSSPVLKPGEKGSYSFDFVLGALEENRELKTAPAQAQLDKLQENALDATLVVSIEGKEITRFNLDHAIN